MKYSVTPPTEAGYYWLKDKDGETIVEIWSDPENLISEREFFVHRCGSGDCAPVAYLKEALWAGPIPHPETPAVRSLETSTSDESSSSINVAVLPYPRDLSLP